ncbi:MAG TPA: glycosyltransferase [Phycisphaerales bacterium]|nr:glycosyltransferase [Phycisphaerales bacterium]HMP38644.1 glycosyltransferase [Phycisphaerales bacterium]
MIRCSTFADGCAVAALIATCGRFDLLFERALPSILGQTRLPDLLLIVVDISKDALPDSELESLRQEIRARCGHALSVHVLRNRRTAPRAAGAWNTGIDHLHRDPEIIQMCDRWFVAILDDDDAWAPDHVQLCLEAIAAGDLNMVASGLVRHLDPDDPGHRHSIPSSLCARTQFIEGQHMQGSNLFVRLDVLLQAGLFDEHLPSCTDRDLCIRLAALPSLRFGSTSRHTVHHYADGRADRLSAPGSPAKIEGLNRFWRKYAPCFDEAARVEMAERALKLFGWRPPEPVPVDATDPPLLSNDGQLGLIVGFVTDAVPRRHVEGLLEDLRVLQERADVPLLRVIVVENGPIPEDGRRPLHDLVSACREQGLGIELISIERQRSDWKRGALVDTPDPAHARLPIAVSRTVLHVYVAHEAARHPGAAAWILDDDKRLHVRVSVGPGTADRPSPDIAALLALRDSRVHVVIGPDTEAAPLPFVATVRGQLLDLDRQLAMLAVASPNDAWLDLTAEDFATRALLPESYYDLSRQPEHLETPFTVAPPASHVTCLEVLEHTASRVHRLLAGEAVLRPLAIDPGALALDAAVESVQRGGSTIFFDPTHLLAYPQTLARFGDRFVRRSDMLVTQLMRDQMGLRIVQHASAGVRHDRSCTDRCGLDDSVMADDVLGYALHRSLDDLMQARPAELRRPPHLAWSVDELEQAVRLVRKYIEERLAAFSLSAWRIRGLADSVRQRARGFLEGASHWVAEEARRRFCRIIEEMDRIHDAFEPTIVLQHADRIRRGLTDADIRGAFESMDGCIAEYRATCGTAGAPGDAVAAADRERRARTLLEGRFGARDLRLLGSGGEGIVFTDGTKVYKVCDLLKQRPNHDTLRTLKALAERLHRPKHLYPIERVEQCGSTLVLVCPFEPSEPYAGGCGAELLALLRECKSAGVVCRNIHPRNLRVSVTGLKLIDYGSDIRPYSDAGYRSMAERAWLTWRWPHRSDLDAVMRRALVEKSLPELDGFERFWRALNDDRPSATRIVAAIVEPIVLECGARSVLDYGCGKKARSARRFAEAGLRSVGFDPGEEMADCWRALAAETPALLLTTERSAALAAGPYDAVVASLLLCELSDGPEYEQVLADIRASVRESGLVVITVCNPLSTFCGPTAVHRRRDLPKAKGYDDAFQYSEVTGCGGPRMEFHRPLARLERDLQRHGLVVEGRVASETVDTERFEPASDFMTLVCRPIPKPAMERQVSLLIKTCAMEAKTIERQVEHLVCQLERPRTFCERVLVVDSLSDGFVRQHAAGDVRGVIDAAERLLARGVVDRVLRSPSSEPQVRAVMRRWFDVECTSTHSAAGAPLMAPLWAIEQCSGDFILQVDSDILVTRLSNADDYLSEMIEAIETDPRAVTASLSVPCHDGVKCSASKDGVPWRIEVRGCLLHRDRLLAARPFPNPLQGDRVTLSWHRSLDRAAKEGRIASLRGACPQTAFVHPPNELKQHVQDWMLMLDLIERYPAPAAQIGKVELVGGPLSWIPRDRSESFVFIVTGRDVPPGRVRRCLDSMAAQCGSEWGAVIIDDGSQPLAREALRLAVEPLKDRITLLQPRERRGQMANMTLAIRHVCTNPESIIVTLDLDDALIGSQVLNRVAAEYAGGAEVTVGSMLRTDKHVEYVVDLDSPRERRGGNVWQHLRTFRKHLFDAIPDQDLRVGDGYPILAVDWAFMLPIVDMAQRKAWIREPLYLYEPSGMGKGVDRPQRELQVGAIVRKPHRTRRSPHERMPLCAGGLTEAIWPEDGGVLFVRNGEPSHHEALSGNGSVFDCLTELGRREATALGRRLGPGIHVVSSPDALAVQTAIAMTASCDRPGVPPPRIDALVDWRLAGRLSSAGLMSHLGWKELLQAWLDGSIAPGILIPCSDLASAALRGALGASPTADGQRVVAVTHDFVVLALLAALRGSRLTEVPYLAGVLVGPEEIRSSGLLEEGS